MGAIGGGACTWIAQTPDANHLWQGMAVLGIGSAMAGGIGWFNAHKRLKRDYAQRRQQRMIAVAKQKRGRVTDVELVAETRYPLDECRDFLKEMTESGSAEMQIGKEGTMVYLFPGFLTEDEKREALPAAEWQPQPRQSPPSLSRAEDSPSSPRSLEIE
ncbi:MAG: hypothetical protein ACKVHP_16825 [Verrucomicrobiales bacterium]